MTDDAIEAMIFNLIKIHLDEDNRKAAIEWLQKRVATYSAMAEHGLLPKEAV